MRIIKLLLLTGAVSITTLGLFELIAGIFYTTNGKIIVAKKNILFIPDNQLSYVLKPGFRISAQANNLYPGVAVTINSSGMRDEEPTNWKNERIWILGDSNTFGFGVNLDDTFAKQLEDMINSNNKSISVINGGVPGYNIFQEKLFLLRYLNRISPNLVILAFYINDIEEVYVPHLGGQTVRMLPFYPWQDWTPQGNLEWMQRRKYLFIPVLYHKICRKISSKNCKQNIVTCLDRYRRAKRFGLQETKERLREFYERRKKYLKYLSSDNNVNRWKRAEKQIVEIRDILQDHSIDFIVIILPFRVQVSLESRETWIQERIIGLCKSGDIQYIDMLPVLKKYKEHNIYLNLDSHPNRRGHGIIAQSVYRHLLSTNIID